VYAVFLFCGEGVLAATGSDIISLVHKSLFFKKLLPL